MELTPFLFGLYKLVKYALYPLNWVLLLMMLTTLLILLPSHPRRLRWARISSVCALFLFLIISSPLLARPLFSSLEAWYPLPTVPKDYTLRCHCCPGWRRTRTGHIATPRGPDLLLQEPNYLRGGLVPTRLRRKTGADRRE